MVIWECFRDPYSDPRVASFHNTARSAKTELKELNQGILSYYGHGKKLPLNGWKTENYCLPREISTKAITINHKGTRMAKDGED